MEALGLHRPPADGGPRILAEVASPPLDSLASEINRRSLNLGAELLLQWAGGRDAAHERLTEHVREVIGTDGRVHLVDGSGLSYDDRVTPSAFISYLARFPGTAAGQNFPQLLPANGTGTLRRLNSGFPGEGVVRAKTGTLGQVSTVVGYLGRPEGVLIVTLMYNGRRPGAARQAQWKLFRELGANGVVIPADSIDDPAGAARGRADRQPGLVAGQSAVGGFRRRRIPWRAERRPKGRTGWESEAAGGCPRPLLLLGPAGAGRDEHHAPDHREHAKERRDRNATSCRRRSPRWGRGRAPSPSW